MNKSQLFIWSVLLLIGLGQFSGCISSHPKALGEEGRAKLFAVEESAASVYVFRSEGLASGVVIPVWLDGVPLVQTSAKSFFVLKLEPGDHTFTSKTHPEHSITLPYVAGNLYFIWQDVDIGLVNLRSRLQQVSTQKGMESVRRCELIKGFL